MQQKVQQFNLPPPNYDTNIQKTNGFSHTPSIAQIASYIVIATTIAVYCSSTISLSQNPILITLYSLFGVAMIISSFLATIIDPTDRVVYYYKWSIHDKQVSFNPEIEKVLYCTNCDSYCCASSKHCRACNRCVNEFDHHCMWFNNCVGQRNYKHFFISIISTFAYGLVVIVHVAIASFSVDRQDNSQLIKIILCWIIAAICAIFDFLLFNLIALHIYLWSKEQTTYQFLQRKKQEEEQEAKKQRIQQIIVECKQKKVASFTHLVQPARDKHIDMQSEDTFANTKTIVVHSRRQAEEGIQQEGLREERSEIQRNTKIHEGEDLAKEPSDQASVIKNADSNTRLPPFLRKNKSLTLLLSSPEADQPSSKLQPLSPEILHP